MEWIIENKIINFLFGGIGIVVITFIWNLCKKKKPDDSTLSPLIMKELSKSIEQKNQSEDNFDIVKFKDKMKCLICEFKTGYGCISNHQLTRLSDRQEMLNEQRRFIQNTNLSGADKFTVFLQNNNLDKDYVSNTLKNDFVPILKGFLQYKKNAYLPYYIDKCNGLTGDEYQKEAKKQFQRQYFDLLQNPFYRNYIYKIERAIVNYLGYDVFTDTPPQQKNEQHKK
ncbi:MAG: hypothetical protein FWE63_02140 [Bacteroidales bacterium]|nr:hypothetical protein [Bacteroidales bacterium]